MQYTPVDNSIKVLITKDANLEKLLIQTASKMDNFYYLPFWFEITDNEIFMHPIKSLPQELKDSVLKDREEAIQFAEWLSSEGYQQYDGKDRWISPHNSNCVYETKQLYEMFLK